MTDFQKRMYDASEDVYARIERGELHGPGAVEAALLDAQLQASSSEDDDA